MNTIREDLEAVVNAAENQGKEESGRSKPADSQESVRATPTPQEIINDKTPTEKVEVEADAKEKVEDKVDAQEPNISKLEEKEEPKVSVRPPAGWSAQAREVFSSLPKVAQDEILRRERDYSVGIQKNAEAGKFGQRVKEVLAPFQAIIQMEGADEIQAVQGLASTAASLRLGTPVEKAQTITRLIKAYGVDIRVLDDVLSGQSVDDEDHKINKILEQRLAPIQQFVQTVNQQRLQQGQQVLADVDKEIAEFESSAEFINEVRDDMADLMEVAAQRGRSLTLKDAYDRAVAMNPELKKILDDRKRAEEIKASAVKINEKKAAASSVHGSSAGMGKGAADNSLRAQLEAAWDAHAG